jgi:hypothetical protein
MNVSRPPDPAIQPILLYDFYFLLSFLSFSLSSKRGQERPTLMMDAKFGGGGGVEILIKVIIF